MFNLTTAARFFLVFFIFFFFSSSFSGNKLLAQQVSIQSVDTKTGVDVATVHTLTTVPAGALLVVSTACQYGSGLNATVSSSPALTWTKRVDAAATGGAEIYTAVFSAGGSITVTSIWGPYYQSSVCYVIINQEATLAGVSGTGSSQSQPSVTVTTGRANSLILCATSDWNSGAGTITYRGTATPRHTAADPAEAAFYHYSYAAATAGAYTVGMTSPNMDGGGSTAVLEIRSTDTPDTTPPSAPTLSTSSTGTTTIGLTWTVATDNVGVTGYDVYVGEVLNGTTATTTYTVTGLTPSTQYSIYVKAKDAAGNETYSNTITPTTTADIQAPSTFTLSSPSQTINSINLSWTAATDNVGVTGYEVYVGGVLNGTTATTTYTVTGLTAATQYSIIVKAKDAANNGTNSNVITPTTSNDTQAPSSFTLSTTGQTGSTISLSWTAATDNVAVTGYDVYVGGVLNGTTATTTYTVTGLTPSTQYSIYAKAKDAAGNGTNSNTITPSTTTTTSGITADNGLNMSTATNVQLGGTALSANTSIPTSPFSLTVTSSNATNSLNIVNTGSGLGIKGSGVNHVGIWGTSTNNAGVVGESNSAVSIPNFAGVLGFSSGASPGVMGLANGSGVGVYGQSKGSGYPAYFTKQDAPSNTVVSMLGLEVQHPELPQVGTGVSIDLFLRSTNGTVSPSYIGNKLVSVVTNVATGTRESQFIIRGHSSGSLMDLATFTNSTGALRLNNYGSGLKTGTPAYTLAVDASGNLIETAAGGGGSITADNGLTLAGNNVKLGGTLSQGTTILSNSFPLTINNVGGSAIYNLTSTGTGSVPFYGVSSSGPGGIFESNTNNGIVASSQTAAGIQASSISGPAGQFFASPATNGTSEKIISLSRYTSLGTPTNGTGGHISWDLPTDFTNEQAGTVGFVWKDVSVATRKSEYKITGVNNAVTADLFTLSGNGATRLNKYGGGTFTGTPVYSLAVDASGNLIETAVGSGGGGGTNYWTTSAGNIYNNNSGLVTIGTPTVPVTTPTDANLKLAVNGNIYAKKIKVTQTGWADYVFLPQYKLPSLKEVEEFIQKNKHLPDVPTAQEVKKNGLDLGDNQAVLLKKIEELTLYLIEVNKKVDKLAEENEVLKRKLEIKEK